MKEWVLHKVNVCPTENNKIDAAWVMKPSLNAKVHALENAEPQIQGSNPTKTATQTPKSNKERQRLGTKYWCRFRTCRFEIEHPF